jgi:hypothetical protein
MEKWNETISTMPKGILGKKNRKPPLPPITWSLWWISSGICPLKQNHEWFVSCEDHPKSNWVVGYCVMSTHFLVVYILEMYKGMYMWLCLFKKYIKGTLMCILNECIWRSVD